jgi:integrase/recombinase XerD
MNGKEILYWLDAFGIKAITCIKDNMPVIFLQTDIRSAVNSILKKHGARWSRSKSAWYIVRSKKKLIHIINDTAAQRGVCIVKQDIILMQKTLALKAYSSHTVQLYTDSFNRILDRFYPKAATDITREEIEEYILAGLTNKRFGESTAHTIINAAKFFYEQVLHRPSMFIAFDRAKKPIKNPTVFSQNEVVRILEQITNVKHRSMLMIGYAAGLRISEIVHLKVNDIDSERMVIYIRQAKGKKDRQIVLSPVLLEQLRNYYKAYRPKDYLFEGQNGGAYSKRSLNLIMQQAKQKAGVQKAGSIHAFRHSFATHLLESGTDISIIQRLLGHNDIHTTLRYTHVANTTLAKVKSPLDDLQFSKKEKGK